MAQNYIYLKHYGLELYILRELWFRTLYLVRTMVWNNISWENYGLELYILRALWFGTIYLVRMMVWNYISCENYGLELYILKELWFEESLPALKGKLPHSRKKHSRKWVYNVPNSPGNGSTRYQTVKEIGLLCTKQSWKLCCNAPKSFQEMDLNSTMYPVQEMGPQCTKQSRKLGYNVPKGRI